MKFRKKPIVVEASPWFKNGDHPQDESVQIYDKECQPSHLREGKIVRRYRSPSIDGRVDCSECERPMQSHGWIDTLEGGHIVCPGDWIITGVKGEHYPCKPDIFAQTYERVEDE